MVGKADMKYESHSLYKLNSDYTLVKWIVVESNWISDNHPRSLYYYLCVWMLTFWSYEI